MRALRSFSTTLARSLQSAKCRHLNTWEEHLKRKFRFSEYRGKRPLRVQRAFSVAEPRQAWGRSWMLLGRRTQLLEKSFSYARRWRNTGHGSSSCGTCENGGSSGSCGSDPRRTVGWRCMAQRCSSRALPACPGYGTSPLPASPCRAKRSAGYVSGTRSRRTLPCTRTIGRLSRRPYSVHYSTPAGFVAWAMHRRALPPRFDWSEAGTSPCVLALTCWGRSNGSRNTETMVPWTTAGSRRNHTAGGFLVPRGHCQHRAYCRQVAKRSPDEPCIEWHVPEVHLPRRSASR